MKIHLFKSGESLMFGINYSKDLFVQGEQRLILSFIYWDLIFEWS